MKTFADEVLRRLNWIISLGVQPGMRIEQESAVNKANFLFLFTVILALVTIVEGLRLQQYRLLPPAFTFFCGALLCFVWLARTGRPFLPCLVMVIGLSVYGVTSMSMGGPFSVEFLLGPVLFPFLYLFCLPFSVALALLCALFVGMALELIAPGDPLLTQQYSLDLRGRILLACVFCAGAAMLGEFMHWRVQNRVQRLVDQLKESAQTDLLTGLYNRRSLLERFDYEIARSVREKLVLSVIMLDIDHFKKINDHYGHISGDAALQHLARLLRANVRQQDTVARWGGEEFVILLPQTNHAGAVNLAEKLRAACAESVCTCADKKIHLTISLGVHQCDLTTDIDANIALVDARMYQAKHLGRNRVEG